jgi:hypothetical protein
MVKPHIGDIKTHKITGDVYVYDFEPSTEKLKWNKLKLNKDGKTQFNKVTKVKEKDLKSPSVKLTRSTIPKYIKNLKKSPSKRSPRRKSPSKRSPRRKSPSKRSPRRKSN